MEDEADRRRVTQSHFSSGEESKDGGGYYDNDEEEEDNDEMMKVARRLNDKSDDDSSDGEESKSDEDGPSQKRGEKHVISPNAVVGTGTTPAKEKHGPVSSGPVFSLIDTALIVKYNHIKEANVALQKRLNNVKTRSRRC